MVIDSSALVAILMQEPEAERISRAIDKDDVRLVSAATVVESTLVMVVRHGPPGREHVDRLLRRSGCQIVPMMPAHAEIACDAFLRYGKGRHPARLNFGDCLTYALAKESGQPLLFKGNDFSQTDLLAVPLPPA